MYGTDLVGERFPFFGVEIFESESLVNSCIIPFPIFVVETFFPRRLE